MNSKELTKQEKITAVIKSYFTAWKKKKVKDMFAASTLTYQSNHTPKHIKDWYGRKKLTSFEILETKEVTVARSDVEVKISYSVGNVKKQIVVTAICICEREAFLPYSNGTWGVNPISVIKEHDLKLLKEEKKESVK